MAALLKNNIGLVGLLGNKLLDRAGKGSAKRAANTVADEREAKARKIASDKKASLQPSTYRGNSTPVSTLLSGPGRSGY